MYALERFADPSAATSDYFPIDQLDVVSDAGSFWDGDFVDDWHDLERLMSERAGNALQDQVFQDIKSIFTRLQRSSHSWNLLTRFRTLLADFSRVALDAGFEQYRIVDMTSRAATSVSLSALGRRIDDLQHILDALVDDGHSHDAQSRGYLDMQVDLFVSEDPPMWLLLSDFASEDARRALLAFLSAEMARQPSSYSPGQLVVIGKAFDAIASQRSRDVALLKPKWFIPWYELVVRGRGVYANRGTDGNIDRAK